MRCLLCSSPRTTGVLCLQHGVAIAAPGVTTEQILSRVAAPAAALVDAWGCPHAIADGTRLGRDRDRNDLAVLHASVSSDHAVFRRDAERWRVIDNASRNGTVIDGMRVRDEQVVPGTVIRFGDVVFYFWDQVLASEPPHGQGRTARAQGVEGYSVRLATPQGQVVELIERTAAGLLRAGDASCELATLEFSFLRLLVERRRQVDDPDFAYIAWHEIADALVFRSIHTDAENVRELAHRVRRKLGKLATLVESKRGVGYRIAAVPS